MHNKKDRFFLLCSLLIIMNEARSSTYLNTVFPLAFRLSFLSHGLSFSELLLSICSLEFKVSWKVVNIDLIAIILQFFFYSYLLLNKFKGDELKHSAIKFCTMLQFLVDISRLQKQELHCRNRRIEQLIFEYEMKGRAALFLQILIFMWI